MDLGTARGRHAFKYSTVFCAGLLLPTHICATYAFLHFLPPSTFPPVCLRAPDMEANNYHYDEDQYEESDSSTDEEEEYDYDDEEEEEDDESESDDDSAAGFVTVYSRDDLLSTTTTAERHYIKTRPGICAGMSLAWLQLIVRSNSHPQHSWPSVSHSRRLQEHIESNYIRYTRFPEIGYMRNDGMKRFRSVDDGLGYVWQNPGSYMLLIRPRREYIGHAVAYSDAQSYPRGYIMNPNNGNHCCHSYAGLAEQFRSDPFIAYSENNRYGADFVIARIVSDDYDTDDDEQQQGDYDFEEVDITAAATDFPYIQFHGRR